MIEELKEIRENVERKLNRRFDDEEVEAIYQVCLRKMALNHKEDDYLPILFESELYDANIRDDVNMKGEKLLCRLRSV